MRMRLGLPRFRSKGKGSHWPLCTTLSQQRRGGKKISSDEEGPVLDPAHAEHLDLDVVTGSRIHASEPDPKRDLRLRVQCHSGAQISLKRERGSCNASVSHGVQRKLFGG